MIVLPTLVLEDACTGVVCGVDEVGRGPWAGPLVAAAVILDHAAIPEGIRDSKTLTKRRLAILAGLIHDSAIVAIGTVDVPELDRIGLTAANDLAMVRAVEGLPVPPDTALTDGRRVPAGMPCTARAVVKGDTRSLSIAAASIVAKVHRDDLMKRLALSHPGYGWETNAGYGTRIHSMALDKLGITREHRRCFRPIRNRMTQETSIDS